MGHSIYFRPQFCQCGPCAYLLGKPSLNGSARFEQMSSLEIHWYGSSGTEASVTFGKPKGSGDDIILSRTRSVFSLSDKAYIFRFRL